MNAGQHKILWKEKVKKRGQTRYAGMLSERRRGRMETVADSNRAQAAKRACCHGKIRTNATELR